MRKIIILITVLALSFTSCFKEEEELLQDFTESGQVTVTASAINSVFIIDDLDNSSTDFTLDIDGEYNKLSVRAAFRPSNKSAIIEEFTGSIPDTIAFSANKIIEALAVDKSKLKVPDEFIIEVLVESKSGTTTASASGSYSVFVACPTKIKPGEYTSVSNGASTDGGTPNPVITDREDIINLTQTGGISFELDNSFGGAYQDWYTIYGVSGPKTNSISDFCGSITGTWSDIFGGTWSISGTLNEETGVITISWVNPYGDNLTSILTPNF